MSIQKSITIFISLCISILCYSQDLESNKLIMKRVIAEHDNYLHATAVADSFDIAVKQAVGMLASQIMTEVKAESTYELSSSTDNNNFSTSAYFSNVTKTFTDIRLSDYHMLLIDKPSKRNKQKYTAFVYISSNKVHQILEEMRQEEERAAAERFAKLKNDVVFYYSEGKKAIQDIRIGDALKYLYWAYILSNNTKITIDINQSAQPAESALTALIDQTLDAIKIICESEKEEKVNEFQVSYIKQLAFYFKQDNIYKKITCLDFKYHNGNTFVSGPRVRDGISIAELNYDLDHFDIHCVYNYDESETPDQISEIMKSKRSKAFTSAYKSVNIDHIVRTTNEESANKQDSTIQITDEKNTLHSVTSPVDTARFIILNDMMEDIENAIRNKQYEFVRHYFTENGYDCFNKLVRYGNASIIGTPQYTFIPCGKLVICRNMTMRFRFRNNKQFIENVNFRFNDENQVESLAFALSDVAQHDILDFADCKTESKLTLLNFMEDYQTAYALKRTDYLEKIFSENALIISGYKVLKKTKSDGIRLNGYTHYDTLSKSQYLNRLEHFFRTKEYINLNFTDTEFKQAWNTEDFFGVRVRQEYFSNTYGDVGYLFLLVDLRGKDPIIHIRAWQDDKLPIEQLFSLKDVY